MQISSGELRLFLKNFSVELFEKYKSTFFQSYLKCYREPELLTVVLMVMLLDEEASKDVG